MPKNRDFLFDAPKRKSDDILWFNAIIRRNKPIMKRCPECEYALRDMSKPIGISSYELTRILPENLKGNLPTIEEIEAELRSVKVKE